MLRTHAFLADTRSAELIAMFEDSVLGVHHLRQGHTFTIGDGVAANFPLANLGDHTEVVRHRLGGGIEIIDAVGMTVELLPEDLQQPMTLSWARELVTERRVASLPAGQRARIALGAVTILVGEASEPRPHPLEARVDLHVHAPTLLAAVIFLLCGAFVAAIPPGAGSLEIDVFALNARAARFGFNPPVPPPAPPSTGTLQDAASGRAAPARVPLTTVRLIRSDLARRSLASHSLDVGKARSDAERVAPTAGILGVMTALESSDVAAVFGPGSALGDSADAMVGLSGDPAGHGFGPGGTGLVEGGHGGQREGGIGVGKIGTGHSGSGSCGGCSGQACAVITRAHPTWYRRL